MAQATDVNATDAARNKADELGVDLESVNGTGRQSAVTARDVEKAAVSGEGSDTKLVRVRPEQGAGEYVLGRGVLDEEYRIPYGEAFPVAARDYDYLMDQERNGAPVLEDASDAEGGGE